MNRPVSLNTIGALALAGLLATTLGVGGQAPAAPAAPATSAAAAAPVSRFPDLAGMWNGNTRARPMNSENYPWTKANFPVLNERGLAYMKAFDEAVAPKYDCVPSSSPAIQYDPYYMQLVQWPDRVVIRYEKDDVTRTIWLDGRKPSVQDYSLQGFSVGRYDGNALIVDTDHFLFDITGFDDYNGIPSSTLKKVTERYWKENGELKMTLTAGGSAVPAPAGVVHHALAGGGAGLPARAVGVRSRVVSRADQDDDSEVQVKRTAA